MWTNENRAKYKRDHLRYPSDLTDEEWGHVEPLIPPARRGGRKRETNMREALNAVMYVLSTGCQWRYVPKDLPPRSTVYRYFCDRSIDGVLDRIHDALYEKCREQAERQASASGSRQKTATHMLAASARQENAIERTVVVAEEHALAPVPRSRDTIGKAPARDGGLSKTCADRI